MAKRKKRTRAKPSPAIKAMQREMLAAGQYTGPIDGLSGPKYEAAIDRREKAADRAAHKRDQKTKRALASAKKAEAEAEKAKAEAAKQDNSPLNKVITLGGQAGAVGIGAYAGHKIASGTRQYMLTAQLAANRQLVDLGAKAAPMVNSGIKTASKARYAQALAGQLKNIKSPKTIVAGVALSSFLAADAAYSHFVGREKAKESSSKSALMAVDTFTATTALASTANLAYTVKEAVMPGVQKATVAAAQVKAVAAMADDFLADPKAAAKAAVGKKSGAKVTKPSAPKAGTFEALKAQANKLGLKVKGNGQGGRVLKADLQAALKEAAKVTGKGNPKSPWLKRAKLLGKAGSKLPGSAKVVGISLVSGAAMVAANSNGANADTGENQMKMAKTKVASKGRSVKSQAADGAVSGGLAIMGYKGAQSMGHGSINAAKDAKALNGYRQSDRAKSRLYDKEGKYNKADKALSKASANGNRALQSMQAAKLSRMGANLSRRMGHLAAANAIYQVGNIAGQKAFGDSAGSAGGSVAVASTAAVGYKASRSTKRLARGLKAVGKFAVTRGLAPIIAVSAAAQAAYNTKGGAGAKAKAGTKAGAYAGITTAAFMAGPVLPVAAAVGFMDLAHAGYKDVQNMKKMDAAGQAKWHKDKRTAIAGGSLQQKFSALSPAQKAKFQTLDKAGRKAMLEGGAYLNKSAAEKAKTSPKAKAKTGSSKRDAAAQPKRAGRFYTRVVNGKTQRVKNPNYGK